MGAAMAARLIEVGHTLTVWNRSPEKAKPLADMGARVARTPVDLATHSDTIITILTDAAAIQRVYSGTDGVLSGDIKGKLFIDMSTVAPNVEIALADKLRAKGAGFVDCPVGGTIAPARQGKLLGMMGGAPEDIARAKPILDQLCRRVEHVGPAGSGALLKLTVNLPLMIYWQALGEALALSRDLKLDPQFLIEFMSDTSGANAAIKSRGGAIAKMLAENDAGGVAFTIDSGRKDLRTMLEEGARRGVKLPLVQQTLRCFDEASAQGWGDRDASMLAAYSTKQKG